MISGAGDHVPATQAKRHSKPTLVWGQQNLTSWSFHGNLLRWFRRKFPARKKVITGKQWSESKSSSSWAIGSKDFNGFQWTFTWPSHCWVAACPLDAQACRPAAPAPLEQPERHGEICWAACIGQDPALACWIPRPSPTHRISMLTQIHEPPVCLGGNMAQPVPSLEESSVFADETPKSTSNQWLRGTGLLQTPSISHLFWHQAKSVTSKPEPERRRSTELQRIWLFSESQNGAVFFVYVKCIFVLNHLICISKFLWRFLVDIVNWSCRWWSHELLPPVDPRSDKAQALLVTYRTASARICRALMSFSRGQRTKRGDPILVTHVGIHKIQRSRDGCSIGYTIPICLRVESHPTMKKLPIYMTIMTETPTLPRWITGTTRLPPARTETAHAFSGHRSLGRWQRPTTDPYHHMINVNVNVNTILISIQSMSIPPQMSFLV